jgi:hypothetical protein
MNSKSYRSLFLSISMMLIIIAFSGCRNNTSGESDDQKSTNKYIDLYLRYLEKEKQAKITATFYELEDSNSRKPIEDQKKIWFQGRAIDPIPGDYKPGAYQLDLESVQPDEFEFMLEVSKNKTERLLLDLKKKNRPEVTGFSLFSGLEINLSSLPLLENQNLVVIVSDKNGTASSMEVKGPFKGQAILSSTNFSTLIPGESEIYLVWKGRSKERIGGFTAEIDLEYYFDKLTFTLSDK